MSIRQLLIRSFYVLALPIVLLIVWWVASEDSTVFFFPSLRKILKSFFELWFGERLLTDVAPSLVRLLAGYFAAVIVGVVAGILIGISANLRALVEPVLEFIRAIPAPVLIPVVMLFSGLGDQMKVTAIAIGCIWPVLLNTVEGARGIDSVLRDTARAYQWSRRSVLFKMVLPGASPQIFAGARVSLAIALIVMIVSEMFAANSGLGFSIVFFQENFQIAQMWSGVLFIGLIGLVLSVLFQAIENLLLKWYRGLRASERGGV